MSRRHDLEKLIMDSYQVIVENDSQIQVASPKEKLKLQKDNDEYWNYIKNYLGEYTNLCERLKLLAPEAIIQIAAARFPEHAEKLISAPTAKPRPKRPQNLTVNVPTQQEEISLFRMNYHFAQQFIPMDIDVLSQYLITFSNRGDVDFSQVNVVTHLCLVLDVSGSMDTVEKYPYLLQAIPYVINSLDDNDWLSIILFSSRSEVVWSMDVASSRRHEQEIIQRIDQSGVKFARTHLALGLHIALNEVEHFSQYNPEAVTRLYILTDGQLHDPQDCYKLNSELRRLEVEINSYGFGEDFAEDTMRQIMKGCQGGRVKWVGNTETLWESFQHIGEVAHNIVASDSTLELIFSTQSTPGDTFRFDPGTHWFGTVSDQSKRFHTTIGGLEKDRVYIYAFETRLYPSKNKREHVATANLRYSFRGKQHTLTQDLFVDRTNEEWRLKQIDKEVQYIFHVLDGLRASDPKSLIEGYRARLAILLDEGGDRAQIELLKKAVDKLNADGTLEGFSEFEKRRLRADHRTTVLG